ncbi:MAG: hypothetical protein R3B09_05730 [Nannocystaceae bacterium]
MSYYWVYRRIDEALLSAARDEAPARGWATFLALAVDGAIPQGGAEAELPGSAPDRLEPALLRVADASRIGAEGARATEIIGAALRGDGSHVSTAMDTGYGTPCVLTASRVRAIAEVLRALKPDDLADALEPELHEHRLPQLLAWRDLYLAAARHDQPVVVTPTG